MGSTEAYSPLYSCNMKSIDNRCKFGEHLYALLLFFFFALGDTAVACEGLCKVIWSLEIDLTNGRVYLTGEPDVLGCWNPDLAIPLSPSLQMANLWETEIMVLL